MMKLKNIFLLMSMAFSATTTMAQTDGFSYQATVRNAKGELLGNTNIGLHLTLADSAGTKVMYSETQTAQTNAYGVMSVTVGRGTPQDNRSLADVDWAGGKVWLHVEVDAQGGSNYIPLGSTRLQAVPYALYAASGVKGEKGDKGEDGMAVPGSKGQTLVHDGTSWVATDQLSVKKLDVKGSSAEEALFEVKDKDGNVVFAVYPNEVHVYVDEDDSNSKKRSGLIVTGRNTKGDSESDYLVVNPTGTQVFVDENDGNSKKRSGLIVTGRSTKGDSENDYLIVNPTGTQVFVDENDGNSKKRSGLIVTGRSTKGDSESDYFIVNPTGTQVFVDDELEGDSKAKRSGFVVSGRSSKGDTPYLKVATDGTLMHFDESDAKKRSGLIVTGRSTKGYDNEFMTINTDSTRFYINGGNGEKGDFGVAGRSDGAKEGTAAGGFAVSGRNGAKDGASSNLFNIDLSTNAQTLNGENRIYWYPEKNAFMAGNLVVEHPDSVGTNSFSAGYQNKSIGEYSQALGYQSVAKGDYTTAIGREARAISDNSYAFGNKAHATGQNAVAIGNMAKASAMNAYALGMNSEASGEGSYAIGEGATASGTGSFAFGRGGKALGWDCEAPKAIGDYSYAIGSGTEAKMVNSIAIGFNSKAEKENALALGFSSTASGGNAVALGWCCEASGGWSTAMGRCSSASKYYSVAIGFHASATAPSEVVVGTYNDETDAPYGSVDSDSPNSRAFVVGSGWESWPGGVQHLRNAMVVLRNGDVAVTGNLTYKSASQSSDMRLKKDVQQLDSALDKVLKLRGVSYYWKNADELKAINGKELFGFDDKKHIGVIAQEVEAVVPELVVTGNDGFKSVTYENIAPLLIEAMKEQQAIIDGQQKEIDELKAANSKLQSQIEEILKKLDK